VAPALKWDREFESAFLQRGVRNEPSPEVMLVSPIFRDLPILLGRVRIPVRHPHQQNRKPDQKEMPRIRATTRPHRYGETFAHDRGTLGYFCREVDRPSGLPVLPTMIAEGIPVLSRSRPCPGEVPQAGCGTPDSSAF
jgi:hypothetical protein